MNNLTKSLMIAAAFTTAAGYCSDQSENLFIKARGYQLQRQDSLACIVFSQAYKEDTASPVILEAYSNSLLKIKDSGLALDNLRKAAELHNKAGHWYSAYLDYKAAWDINRKFKDGSLMALAIFRDGIEKHDSIEIDYANRLWNLLIRTSISNKCRVDVTIWIIDIRIQAYKEAALFLHNPSKSSRPVSPWSCIVQV